MIEDFYENRSIDNLYEEIINLSSDHPVHSLMHEEAISYCEFSGCAEEDMISPDQGTPTPVPFPLPLPSPPSYLILVTSSYLRNLKYI